MADPRVTGAVTGAASGAMAGAAAGSVIPGVGTAIGAGVGGIIGGVGGFFAGSGQADSAEAYAQMAAAQAAQAAREREQAMGAANPSFDELQNLQNQLYNMNRLYAFQSAQWDRESKMLEAQSPGLLASAQSMYDLMSGKKESGMLKPLRDQLEWKRSQLQGQLREQLGPGAEQSSAGIEAMSKFDNQSAMTLEQAQLQAIQMGGYGLNAATSNYEALRGNFGLDATQYAGLAGIYAQDSNFIKNRQLQALLGTSQTPYAGSEHVQDALNGAASGSYAKSALQLLAQGGGYALGSVAGRYNPSSPGSTNAGIPNLQDGAAAGGFGGSRDFSLGASTPFGQPDFSNIYGSPAASGPMSSGLMSSAPVGYSGGGAPYSPIGFNPSTANYGGSPSFMPGSYGAGLRALGGQDAGVNGTMSNYGDPSALYRLGIPYAPKSPNMSFGQPAPFMQ